eukprot:5761205-Alexandrium_andersonii.AAC.1
MPATSSSWRRPCGIPSTSSWATFARSDTVLDSPWGRRGLAGASGGPEPGLVWGATVARGQVGGRRAAGGE